MALGTAPLWPHLADAASAAPRRLIAGTRSLEVNGRAAKIFSLTDATGQPGIILAPNERFHVDLVNQTRDYTIIHWHGQLPPWTQDGFPWAETPPIATGQTHAYDYAPIPGTFWMHSHQGMQEQSLMTAPLIVHSAIDLRADHQEIVLMLHDFSFRTPDALLANLAGITPAAAHAMGRSTESVPAPSAPPRQPADGSGMRMSGMGGIGGMGAIDANDIAYDAFLANDRTLADPAVIRVGRAARVRLRVINGSSSSQFWLDLGGLTGTIIAVDGHAVHPISARTIPLAIAQRVDILLTLPASGACPILARLEGSRQRTGIILATAAATIPYLDAIGPDQAPPINNSLEARLTALTSLAPRQPNQTHQIILQGSMKPYVWTLNGEAWPNITPLMLKTGQRILLDLHNRSMMAHPMHLHGHAFQVIALNHKRYQGAVRDTVLVPPMAHVRIAFDANNPGRWAFHCHNLYHMMTGMMTEFRYQGVAV
jgi:FtsP/CotA-like multicopper oxidase with cupredoxin domain